MQSPLKYPGGKSFLVEKVALIFSKYSESRWVDICCGGLSLPLAIAPKRALLSDANPSIINFWEWVKSDAVFNIEMQNDKEFFYNKRKEFNSPDTDASLKAQLLYYLNKTCYNGLVRFSRNGFNTPMGRHKSINYKKELLDYKEAIANWEFHVCDFHEILGFVRPDDFIYSDPPYCDVFSGYYGKFGWKEQYDLAKLLALHPGPVVASNSDAPEILLLYSELGFEIELIDAPRSISCKKRLPVKEMFATRNINV